MHEALLAEQILGAALTEAGRVRAKSVTRLTLKLGGLEGVSAETLEAAFRERARGTLAERAELAVDVVPGRVRCVACGAESDLAGVGHGDPGPAACPRCGGGFRVLQGRGWVLEAVRVQT